MENNRQQKDEQVSETLLEAKDRIDEVEAQVEKARTSADVEKSRVELAKTRAELAEARATIAEARAQQVETTLMRVIQKGIECADPPSSAPTAAGEEANLLAQLTSRQREVLRLIAEGQNTKQIADVLGLSPKTVEYHRAKLMRVVRMHDVPGLVRLAVRAGLVAVKDEAAA